MWRHYFPNLEALVFVVDSHDRERRGKASGDTQSSGRLDEAARELHQFLNEPAFCSAGEFPGECWSFALCHSATVLVVATKTDLDGCLSSAELWERLRLWSFDEGFSPPGASCSSVLCAECGQGWGGTTSTSIVVRVHPSAAELAPKSSRDWIG